MKAHAWSRYSKKLTEKILNPMNGGELVPREGMRLYAEEVGSIEAGNWAYLTLLVDEEDGVIADAKFRAFGDTAFIGALEVLCDLMVRKNYLQASRIGADMLDHRVRDFSNEQAFPSETHSHLNLALDLIDNLYDRLFDIPIAEEIPSPLSNTSSGETLPGWDAMTDEEKIAAIKAIIREDIQPYIELDAGGIEVLELRDGLEVIIAYQGACTTCPSSTGATLTAIQQILRSKVHPSLIVTPDKSFLQFV